MGGRSAAFPPKTFLSRKQITVIRPLVFCEEREIKGAARRLDLPVVKSACPADGVTARKDTEELVKKLEKDFPHLRQKVLGAMQRAGLDDGESKYRSICGNYAHILCFKKIFEFF